MTRSLRITASVFFVLLTVLLCVLWVRSYWFMDRALKIGSNGFAGVISSSGAVGYVSKTDNVVRENYPNWIVRLPGRPTRYNFPIVLAGKSFLGFRYAVLPNHSAVFVPYWLLVLLATCAALPFIDVASLRRRYSTQFSLRTLLIAVTFVAAVIGPATWLAS